jgi:hypothetical protein
MVTPAFACLLALVIGLGLAGCPGTEDDDSSGDDDIVGDDDDAAPRALLRYEGSARVDAGSYAGGETLVLEAGEGSGAELCRVSYTLTSTALRDDCAVCEWAFDLVLTDPVIVSESGVGCGPFGYSAEDVAALDGLSRAYGYAEEYVGHASMLMAHDGSLWQGLSFATFVPETGDFSYGWDAAYVPY